MKPKENYTPGPNDLCQTPAYGLEPLIPYLKGIRRVWEPAAGEGRLAKALSNVVETVKITDIQTGHDFLSWKPPVFDSYDAIVTNPPYSMKKEFAERCCSLEKPWALLMPAETIANKWFIELANKLEPKPGIIWVSPRIHFKMPNKGWEGSGAQFNIAWFTWNMGLEGNKYTRMNHWTKEYRETRR